MVSLTKTTRGHQEFSELTPDWECRLELWDPKDNANKFWHIFVYGSFVVRHWGRHGSKGQWSVHRTWADWAAREAASGLVNQKHRKGYKTEASVLDRFAREVG